MIHLYMDDMRRCPAGFTLVRSGQECLEVLRTTQVDILSLDYDMGPDGMTGGEVAAVMASEGLFAREIYLHTSSLHGKMSMYETLYTCKPDHVILHNGPIPFDRLDEIAHQVAKKTK
ncbi:cyclic-phosphate processing receiver domain-containing protein [Paenibacillus sp. SN-8-1]|uniref:cyclic-phosphate processing receiver domain-containing protein n=1 Tax=Paenibacillus sp. SN-8-1 TaxID=3435409 RepID=UPI003D9A3AA9